MLWSTPSPLLSQKGKPPLCVTSFRNAPLPSFWEIVAWMLPSSIMITNHLSASLGLLRPTLAATSSRLSVKNVFVSRLMLVFMRESLTWATRPLFLSAEKTSPYWVIVAWNNRILKNLGNFKYRFGIQIVGVCSVFNDVRFFNSWQNGRHFVLFSNGLDLWNTELLANLDCFKSLFKPLK